MTKTKQEYLQDVLSSYRMKHISTIVDKFKQKRDELKEALEEEFKDKIYSPKNSGSFAKHTAINSKFDLDLIVPFKRASFDTLEKMFDETYNFLYNKYSNSSTVRKQKVSIGITFFVDEDEDEISLDIVPGRELNEDKYPDDNKINLYVNSKFGIIEEKTYLQTNIQAQIDHIKGKENTRKIIRLLKIWKTKNNENYKSFLLELLVIKAYDQQDISGNLWNQLKLVIEYIRDNITNTTFSLKDPGNSNNNVVETLESYERQLLSDKLNSILKNIESNEDNLKIYFPENSKYIEDTPRESGYGWKDSSTKTSTPPNNQRFG